ncbi:MAG: hypothetical protein Q7T44_12395 [Parvibaculum sp.]|nr:hypothetical protein [Parvibaculum sp.]
MFKNPKFNEWLSAAATAIGSQIGVTRFNEMPARQAQFVQDALISSTKEPVQLDFIEVFKAAAD